MDRRLPVFIRSGFTAGGESGTSGWVDSNSGLLLRGVEKINSSFTDFYGHLGEGGRLSLIHISEPTRQS